MNTLIYVIVVVALCACSNRMDEKIDMAYVKDCNQRGGRIERIEYSYLLQCVGAQNRSDAK
jgi:hypothetical protein